MHSIPGSAYSFLDRAKALLGDRGKEYDQGNERSMGKAIEAFNAITGRDLKESEGLLLMVLLKQVRQWSADGYHKDSAEDAISYSALLAESLLAEAASKEGGV